MIKRKLEIAGVTEPLTIGGSTPTPKGVAHAALAHAVAAVEEGECDEAQAWAAIGQAYAHVALLEALDKPFGFDVNLRS